MSVTDKIKSPVGICRVVTIILGFIILVMGLHSHFTSTWVKTNAYFEGVGELRPYKLCDIGFHEQLPTEKCPPIAMERFFVAMVILSFILSVCGFIIFLVMNKKDSVMKYVDMTFHGLIAVLLIIAAILYILSAEQIHDFFVDAVLTGEWHFRREEKVAAAALTIIQSLLYGITTAVIMKY